MRNNDKTKHTQFFFLNSTKNLTDFFFLFFIFLNIHYTHIHKSRHIKEVQQITCKLLPPQWLRMAELLNDLLVEPGTKAIPRKSYFFWEGGGKGGQIKDLHGLGRSEVRMKVSIQVWPDQKERFKFGTKSGLA